MNRMKFSLVVLLLLGLSIQPCIAQRSIKELQLESEKYAASLSKDEMRAKLPVLKKKQEELRSILKTGNYSKYHESFKGRDALSVAMYSASITDAYNCVTADINAIEKRLRSIDSKRGQEQKAQEKQQQQTQGQQEQDFDEQRQVEFQQSVNKKKEDSERHYMELKKAADNNADRAASQSVAQDMIAAKDRSGFQPITTDMLEKKQTQSSVSQQNISDVFQKKKQEAMEAQNKKSGGDFKQRMEKIRKSLDALRKSIEELPVEE
ncbi:MAG: hypothetical protein II825_04405 [Paludibacteraceae bacterium]|nr:hypothetical protein [Paludibacteraceae bacterium]